MITLLGYSFSLGGLVLSLLFALFVLTQMSWWFFELYFPNTGACMLVHKNSRKWFDRECRILKALESPTVLGILFTLLLPAIVVLNVTLLAQVFEMFVPPGERVPLPYIGTYATFPLIVGVLYALIEIAFSAIYEMKRENKDSTFIVSLLIGVLIFVEAGLHYYRARLLTSGDLSISAAIWDKITMEAGSVLAGLLGIMVPLALVYLARYSVIPAILPLVKDFALVTRFVLSSTFWGLIVLYFGFHNKKPIVLPGPLGRLVEINARLKKYATGLQERVIAIQALGTELSKIRPVDINHLSQQIDEFDKRVNNFETTLLSVPTELQNDKVEEMAETAKTKKRKSILRSAVHMTRKWIKARLADLELRRKELVDINDLVYKTPKQHSYWRKKLFEFKRELQKVKTMEKALREQSEHAQVPLLCASIEAALSDKHFAESVLDEVESGELRQLTHPLVKFDLYEKKWQASVGDMCRSVVKTVRAEWTEEVKSRFEHCCHVIEETEKLDEATINSLDEATIQQFSSKLIALDNRLTQLESDCQNQWNRWRESLLWTALQVLAPYIYFNLLFSRKLRA